MVDAAPRYPAIVTDEQADCRNPRRWRNVEHRMTRLVGPILVLGLLMTACGDGRPRSSTAKPAQPVQGSPTVSATRSETLEDATTCKSAVGRATHSRKNNRPMKATLCVSSWSPRVGERITFTVRASDPDAEVLPFHACGPSRLLFGDEGTICAGSISCPKKTPVGPTERTGRLRDASRHTYTRPGTYEVSLALQSGAECPHIYGDHISVTAKVVVRK